MDAAAKANGYRCGFDSAGEVTVPRLAVITAAIGIAAGIVLPLPAAGTPWAPGVASAAAPQASARSGPAVRKIRLEVKPAKTVVGHRVRLMGRVQPAQRHVRIRLQRWTGSRWVKAAQARTDGKGEFAAKAATPRTARRTWYRAKAAGDSRITSGNVEVRLKRRRGRSAGEGSGTAPGGSAPPPGASAPGTAPAPTAPATPSAPDVTPLDPRTLAAGGDATCGLDPTGAAWCWGAWGSAATAVPTKVAGGRAYTTITVSAGTACALDRLGGAWCWGDPSALGGASAADRSTPVAVAGDHTFTAMSGGAGERPGICALDRAGAAWCWGWGLAASEGTADVAWDAPRRVAATMTGLTGIAVGAAHVCVLDSARQAWCWGRNEQGQLGSGNPDLGALATAPVAVSGARTWRSITAGPNHTCAIATTDARAWCWGGNKDGQLGSAILRNFGCAAPDGGNDWFCHGQPVLVESSRSDAGLSAGMSHTCAFDTASRTQCWGDGFSGQLGTGTRLAPTYAPQSVAGSFAATAVAAGRQHTCALGTDSRVRCWGDGDLGQLGNATTPDFALSPVDVSGPALRQP